MIRDESNIDEQRFIRVGRFIRVSMYMEVPFIKAEQKVLNAAIGINWVDCDFGVIRVIWGSWTVSVNRNMKVCVVEVEHMVIRVS